MRTPLFLPTTLTGRKGLAMDRRVRIWSAGYRRKHEANHEMSNEGTFETPLSHRNEPHKNVPNWLIEQDLKPTKKDVKRQVTVRKMVISPHYTSADTPQSTQSGRIKITCPGAENSPAFSLQNRDFIVTACMVFQLYLDPALLISDAQPSIPPLLPTSTSTFFPSIPAASARKG